MDFIRRLICVLIWTAQGPIFAICLDNMLSPNEDRCSRSWRVLLWALGSLITGAIHVFAPPGPIQIGQLVFQVVYIGVLLWQCYQDRPLTRVMAMVLLYIIPMALDIPFSAAASAIMDRTPVEHYLSMDATYVVTVASLQLTAIALQGLACFFWRRRRRTPGSQGSATFLLGFALTGVCIFTSGIYVEGSPSGSSAGVYMTVVTCIFFIICAAVFVVLSQAEKEAISKRLAETRRLAELEQTHYAAIEARREEMVRIRSDYNGILTTVLQQLQSGDAAQAEELLMGLSVRIAATQESPFCSIPIINAILTEKQQQCEKDGIPFHADLLLPDALPIQDLDLCSAFSNLMDNAIRVCRRERAPEITLSCRVIQGYLVIKCVNPSQTPPGGKPDNTGYGLPILRDIAARYQGNFFMDYTDGMVTAQLSLLACRHRR